MDWMHLVALTKRTILQMVTAALRFAISHAAQPVAIPGAKSPQQAAMNAAAGSEVLAADQIARLTAAIGD